MLQSAVRSISSIRTPFVEAAVLEAPLTEWALNKEVSIPAFPRISLSQLARRCEVTGLCRHVVRGGSGGSIEPPFKFRVINFYFSSEV